EITSFLLIRKIHINKKARLIKKPQIIFVKFKEINCLCLKKNSAALKTIPMKHMAKPRGFNPNKLYEKPKLMFSSAISGNLFGSRVWAISQVTAVETEFFICVSSSESVNSLIF